jgi:hypothetical protein
MLEVYYAFAFWISLAVTYVSAQGGKLRFIFLAIANVTFP